MDHFLYPIEADVEVLEIYFKALLCEMIKPELNPIAYLIAVHHLNHALFREESTVPKEQFSKLIKSTHMLNKTELKSHLLGYKQFNPNCKYGLETF